MPRKPRIEIGGGLYHVITRGNSRRKIFRSDDDYLKFTGLLDQQTSINHQEGGRLEFVDIR